MSLNNNDEALQSVLVNIRSVVLSCKGGVLLSHLQEDYRKFIGTVIPFENFGYQSLDSLLYDASGYVSVRKNQNGQLYVEAVADLSTAHLSSLISRQKKTKAKKEPKVRLPKNKVCSICKNRQTSVTSTSTNSSTSSKISDGNDQGIDDLNNNLEKRINEELSFEVKRLQTQLNIANKALQSERSYIKLQNLQPVQNEVKEIQDLKMRLEKEMRINKGYSSEVERINALLMRSEESLRIERINILKMKDQLKSFQKLSEEKYLKEKENDTLKKEIEELNSKLKKEKDNSRTLSAQIISLNAFVKVNQNALATERDTIGHLKSEIQVLQEKCKTFQNTPQNDSWNGHLNMLETDTAKEFNSCNRPISDQHSLLSAIEVCEKNMSKQMQKFQNKLNEHNKKILTLEKTQNKHYTKLDNKINDCIAASSIEVIIQRLMKHPRFLESRNCYASDDNLAQCRSSTPTSNQSDIDSEQSFTTKSMPVFAYLPPKIEAYLGKRRQ